MSKRRRSVDEAICTLRPCIADLLRTCYQPLHFHLRIERLIEEVVTRPCESSSQAQDILDKSMPARDGNKIAYRLIGSDGVLAIQAIVATNLHEFFESSDVIEGSVIDLRKFEVHRGKRIEGAGDVIYLEVSDMKVVSKHSKASTASAHAQASTGLSAERRKLDTSAQKYSRSIDLNALLQSPIESEDNFFEEANISSQYVTSRRKALKEISGNLSSQESVTSITAKKADEEIVFDNARLRKEFEDSHRMFPAFSLSQPVDLPPVVQARIRNSMASAVSPPVPAPAIATAPAPVAATAPEQAVLKPLPPLHTLHSLLHPPSPLPKSYTCSILAVISWISPTVIHKPPYPSKRHIKIHDSSIADRLSGITVAVFVDAGNFKPRFGSVVLFQGLIMQRWGEEIILNAYSNIQNTLGESDWFVNDREKLIGMGHDVEQTEKWWYERRNSARTVQG